MIYLTSIGFTNTPELGQAISENYPTNSKVVIIINASEDGAQNEYAQLAQTQLHELGFENVQFADITQPTGQDITRQSNLIYLLGGNTFKLMNDINNSGFKEQLIELIKKNGCIGVSAGSIILGQSIATASIGEGDENSVGLKDLAGLKLVDYDISPHYIEQDEIEIAEYEKNTGNQVKRLSDGQIELVRI